jgi:hypothetical protein
MPQPEVSERPGANDDSRSVEPEAVGIALGECRAWLNWAAAQVDACLSDDNLASTQLLEALAEALAQQQPRLGPASAQGADGAKMSAVVIAVQSHDRVMQGLTHVAESLRALHEQLADPRRAESAESWRALRDKQFRAFSMAQERLLFARMVAHGDDCGNEAHLGPEDTVELFAGDHGAYEL